MMNQFKLNKKIIIIGVGNYGPEGERIAKDSSHRSSWPYLGILQVGTLAKEAGFEVELVDENVEGPVHPDKLSQMIKSGDIVGLSAVVTSTERALHLAEVVKGCGAGLVIMGNDQASARAKQILEQYSSVDGIFLGDNPVAMRRLFQAILEGNPFNKNILSWAWRDSNEMYIPPMVGFADISQMPLPDFRLFPPEYWNKVWENHRQVAGFEYENPATIKNCTINMAAGCGHGRNACNYCSILQVREIRFAQNPDYYEKLLHYYFNFGINSFYEVCDSFLDFGKVIKTLKEIGVELPYLTCYARAAAAKNPRNIERLLGIVKPGGLKFNIGLDSGNDRVLEGLNKGSGMGENMAMIRLMKKYGIKGHFSFIIGGPGETEETVRKTILFIKYVLSELGNLVTNIEPDIYWVNWGAPCEAIFTNYEYARKLAEMMGKKISFEEWERDFAGYANEVVIPWKVEENWYKWFTNITVELAQESIKEVDRIIEKYREEYREGEYCINTGRAYGFEVVTKR